MINSDIQNFVANICKLDERIVVWKHLSTGLSGDGDIDFASPKEVIPVIEQNFVTCAKEHFRDLIGIYRCDHAPMVTQYFLLANDYFPKLLQFDFTFRPTIKGLQWAKVERFRHHSNVDSRGIRVLNHGALGVIAYMLYGLRQERAAISSRDFDVIIKGFTAFHDASVDFVEDALEPVLAKNLNQFICKCNSEPENLINNFDKLNDSFSMKLINEIKFRSICDLSNLLENFILRRNTKFCTSRRIVHQSKRLVNNLTAYEYLEVVKNSDRVLYEKK